MLAELPELPLKIVNQLVSLLESGLEVGRVDSLPAFGARELRVSLNILQGFRELVTALRTGNRDLGVIVVGDWT
jgi:hypothetical protein